MKEAERLTVTDGVRLEVLIDKFSEPCPFRPLDTFNVNFSTAASLSGLAFTYVIVLIQFKQGDKTCPEQPVNLNTTLI